MRKHEAQTAVGLALAMLVLAQPRAIAAEGQTGKGAGISIRWTAAPLETNRVAVEVLGLNSGALRELRRSNWTPAQWGQLFAVYAAQGDLWTDLRLPPMIGSYQIDSNLIRFEPQFPLEPGVRYRAVFRPNKFPDGGPRRAAISAPPITSVREIPLAPRNPTTVVAEIYPTAEVLPENLLKFYIHFSAPMSRGHIYDHIQLRDENGKAVELPFLEIDEELWDPSLTRLTLFIDPGRIKRGVRPLEEIGPALQNGKRYSLVIDRNWKDATGNSLAKTHEKHFQTGLPERESLNPQQWQIHQPKPESLDPLDVTFPKPLDHALALRTIRVFGASSETVPGKAALLDQERRWRFTPERAWTGGRYTLQIDTTLEDLAGNNIGKPFEVDLFEGVQRRVTNEFVKLTFQIR